MERIGCYTTARVTRGRIERLERHAGRLRRDAARMRLPVPGRGEIEAKALAIVGREIGRGDGILRLEWSRAGTADAGDASSTAVPLLSASSRSLGAEPEAWHAITARALHPGPGPHPGTKALGLAVYAAARVEQAEAGVDESLLFDVAGRLVEGSRTNLIVVTADGFWLTPARALGPVDGLGLECAQEAVGAIVETLAIDRHDLRRARELIAVNAVRGAVAIVLLDGRPIGDGRPGPLAKRLKAPFGQR